MISKQALSIIIAAVGHHLDTIATKYDLFFEAFDHLYQMRDQET